MATEIERKFLVRNDGWRAAADAGTPFIQAYLCTDAARTVRVRLAGDAAYLTIKGRPPADAPLETPEFEYAIPSADARALLALCLPGAIAKTRYRLPAGKHVWEIDVFEGDNAGLVVAEIELSRADETFERPDWLGTEVTADSRYKNAALSKNPYKNWAVKA